VATHRRAPVVSTASTNASHMPAAVAFCPRNSAVPANSPTTYGLPAASSASPWPRSPPGPPIRRTQFGAPSAARLARNTSSPPAEVTLLPIVSVPLNVPVT